MLSSLNTSSPAMTHFPKDMSLRRSTHRTSHRLNEGAALHKVLKTRQVFVASARTRTIFLVTICLFPLPL